MTLTRGDGKREMYCYCYVNCKTRGCKERQILKFMGPADRRTLVIDLPFPFKTRCGTCREIHQYRVDDLKMIELPHLPPPGFEDKF